VAARLKIEQRSTEQQRNDQRSERKQALPQAGGMKPARK
jgi:hypothetical protein